MQINWQVCNRKIYFKVFKWFIYIFTGSIPVVLFKDNGFLKIFKEFHFILCQHWCKYDMCVNDWLGCEMRGRFCNKNDTGKGLKYLPLRLQPKITITSWTSNLISWCWRFHLLWIYMLKWICQCIWFPF